MKILVAYSSTHGHTARIAERISARMKGQGHEVVTTGDPRRVRAKEFDAIVLGGRVHGSRYPWRLTRFIRRNARILNSRPAAFFSVSLLQLARNRERAAATQALPKKLASKLGWKPDRIAVFAGALRWKAQYGRLTPLFLFIWRRTLGEVVDRDLSEQVFTDWSEVDRFADTFLREAATMLELPRHYKRRDMSQLAASIAQRIRRGLQQA
jgi:menaquinone-dependent protoporphyrinogen oxidase